MKQLDAVGSWIEGEAGGSGKLPSSEAAGCSGQRDAGGKLDAMGLFLDALSWEALLTKTEWPESNEESYVSN